MDLIRLESCLGQPNSRHLLRGLRDIPFAAGTDAFVMTVVFFTARNGFHVRAWLGKLNDVLKESSHESALEEDLRQTWC